MADTTSAGQGILTVDHLAQLNEAIRQGDEAKRQIALAKAAGIDVSAFEQTLADSLARVRQIKQVYFPGQ